MIFQIKEIDEFKKHILIFESLSKNTVLSYFSDLRQFDDFLIKSNISKVFDLKKEALYNFFSYLHNLGLSKKSFSRKQTSVKKFLKFCIEKNYINKDDADIVNFYRIKTEKKLPKTISNEEIMKIIAYDISKNELVNLRNSLIVMILYSSGIRVSELCNLKIKDFNNIFKNENTEKNESISFIVVNGKGGKERLVPIYPKCVDFLVNYLALLKAKNSNFLFSGRDKKKSISRRMIVEIVKKKAEIAGIYRNISPHVLRHSFATHMLQNGLDIKEIQDILGHENISTTAIYTEIVKERESELIARYHPLYSD